MRDVRGTLGRPKMRDCTITISEEGGRPLVRIQGLISEEFDAREVPIDRCSLEHPMRIDLGGVSRFTSSGVREWIYFVRRMLPGGYVLENCSVGFVQQMSTWRSPGFSPASPCPGSGLP